jgi:hypothetical protein
MNINYTAVLVATVADFIIGAIWYMPIFGDLWGKIHGHDKLSKKEQQEAQKGMGPLLVAQFIVTFITVSVLAKLHVLLPDYSLYSLAGLLWIGFVVPTQVAAIIFGGTKKEWFVQKALIMSIGSLACFQAAAAIINAIK